MQNDKLNVSNEQANTFQLEQAVEQMRRNLKITIEYIELQADLRWKKFEALRGKGFTDAQALELCKGPVVN